MIETREKDPPRQLRKKVVYTHKQQQQQRKHYTDRHALEK